VLNPISQAKRLDPGGAYVRRHLPELAAVPGAAVHEPWELDPEVRRRLDYPQPLVDLDSGRARFLAARRWGRPDPPIPPLLSAVTCSAHAT
jgi:deoxyribodipyrimidine photo-lyase